jgi:hypothetical protein
MVAILKENVTLDFIKDIYQCGGTLISTKLVLTGNIKNENLSKK